MKSDAVVSLAALRPEGQQRLQQDLEALQQPLRNDDYTAFVTGMTQFLEHLQAETAELKLTPEQRERMVESLARNCIKQLPASQRRAVRKALQQRGSAMEQWMGIMKMQATMAGNQKLQTICQATERVLAGFESRAHAGKSKSLPERAEGLAKALLARDSSALSASSVRGIERHIRLQPLSKECLDLFPHWDRGEEFTARADKTLQTYNAKPNATLSQQMQHSTSRFLDAMVNQDRDALVLGSYALVRDACMLAVDKNPGKGIGTEDAIAEAEPFFKEALAQLAESNREVLVKNLNQRAPRLPEVLASVITCMEWHATQLGHRDHMVQNAAVNGLPLVTALVNQLLPDGSKSFQDQVNAMAAASDKGLNPPKALSTGQVAQTLGLLTHISS